MASDGKRNNPFTVINGKIDGRTSTLPKRNTTFKKEGIIKRLSEQIAEIYPWYAVIFSMTKDGKIIVINDSDVEYPYIPISEPFSDKLIRHELYRAYGITADSIRKICDNLYAAENCESPFSFINGHIMERWDGDRILELGKDVRSMIYNKEYLLMRRIYQLVKE